ncbi:MAG: diguanylate cyclase [Bacillota bacterium]
MNRKPYSLLLIEDDRIDQIAFRKAVETKKLDFDYEIVGSAKEAKQRSQIKSYDVIITDYMLGDGTAFDILECFRDTPIVITTGAGNEEIAVKAMQQGIKDYLIKDMENNYLKMLPITIKNAVSRHENEKQLRLLSHAIMSIGDSVYITDGDDKILFVNKAFTDTYGYTSDEITNQPVSILCGSGSCYSGERENSLEESVSKNETSHRKKDGSEFPALISNSSVRDENGSYVATVWVVRDISEIKEAQSKLQMYATTDMLTGVLNRRAGLLILEKQLQMCKRNTLQLTICYIDLNGLKDVNDRYGHQEGDEFILVITNILKDTIREADSLCRLGGDEFLLVFPECGKEDAGIIWDRIQQRLDEYNRSGEKAYTVGISGGFAEYDSNSPKSADELITIADEEMYKNKKKYKERLS